MPHCGGGAGLLGLGRSAIRYIVLTLTETPTVAELASELGVPGHALLHYLRTASWYGISGRPRTSLSRVKNANLLRMTAVSEARIERELRRSLWFGEDDAPRLPPLLASAESVLGLMHAVEDLVRNISSRGDPWLELERMGADCRDVKRIKTARHNLAHPRTRYTETELEAVSNTVQRVVAAANGTQHRTEFIISYEADTAVTLIDVWALSEEGLPQIRYQGMRTSEHPPLRVASASGRPVQQVQRAYRVRNAVVHGALGVTNEALYDALREVRACYYGRWVVGNV